MKKILFVAYRMNVGGVEKALLSMLDAISFEEYDVHLALAKNDGGFLELIPSNVTVHTIESYTRLWRVMNQSPIENIKEFLRAKDYKSSMIHLWFYLCYKVSGSQLSFYRYILKDEKKINEKFDIAVSYAGPSEALDYYVLNKVDALKKCVWIHYDVSQFYVNKTSVNKLYSNFHKIFIVSQTAKKYFDEMFPSFAGKTEVFHNIIFSQNVISLSEKENVLMEDKDRVKIVTVGRLSKEKGQDVALQALSILRKRQLNIHWHFVGDGGFKKECEQLVQELELEDCVIFEGSKFNPYPYMRNCDVYVQPSRHEGYCITLAEARVFSMPIVATDFTGAKEQLCNRKNGFVVGMTAEDMVEGIIAAIEVGKLNPSEITSGDNNDIDKFLHIIA